MSIYKELRDSYKYGSPVTRLLYINVIVFIVFGLIHTIYWIAGYETSYYAVGTWFKAPSYLPELLIKPWSVITYMFFHEDFFHIAFNMLGLYWFGRLFLEFFTKRQLVGLYFIGGIFGYLLFVAGYYSLIPLRNNFAPILGASASVLAILAGVAFSRPNYSIYMMFFGQVKLKYLALIYILLDLVSMAKGNAGGHIAHIGGMFAGWIFSVQLQKNSDITRGINRILDFFATLFKPRKKLKVSHRKPSNDYEYKKAKVSEQKEIDAILDKISRSGYDSLSKAEKELLFKMGQNKS
jgi:membrane associated rhomboid family serine protease